MTQTGINCNKYIFLRFKITGAKKKFKNQPRPLVRPSSVNFCQNFLNLSHETVPLKQRVTRWMFLMHKNWIVTFFTCSDSFKFLACTVKEKNKFQVLLAFLKTCTYSKDLFRKLLSFALIGRFSPLYVHSKLQRFLNLRCWSMGGET